MKELIEILESLKEDAIANREMINELKSQQSQIIKRIEDLGSAIRNLQHQELDKKDGILAREGFICQSNHSIVRSFERGWDASDWVYVIVHESRPQIKFIQNNGHSTQITSSEPFDIKWILGHGETEFAAWQDAFNNWTGDESIRNAALDGIG